MKYHDKNGSEWSLEKGDWMGSFDREGKTFGKKFAAKFSIPLLLLVIISVILLNWN